MSKRIAILFAGQGAQEVGMGRDLAAEFPAVAELFARADTLLGRPISRIAFEGPEEELTKTVHCQPALFLHGTACLLALREQLGALPIHAAAGLSLGEFTAHAAAGTFSFEEGLSLVARRATFMQEACEATVGGMAAMIGGEETQVRELAAQTDVDVANINAPGQIVLSGEEAKVAMALGLAKDFNIRRATKLNVAGAYHSRLMESAYVKLGEALEQTEMRPPAFPVFSNIDAQPVTDAASIRNALREQVTGTVLWARTLERLVDEEKIDQFIELGPRGVLAGLLNRTRKGTPILSISDVPSLQAAVAALRE